MVQRKINCSNSSLAGRRIERGASRVLAENGTHPSSEELGIGFNPFAIEEEHLDRKKKKTTKKKNTKKKKKEKEEEEEQDEEEEEEETETERVMGKTARLNTEGSSRPNSSKTLDLQELGVRKQRENSKA
ncbi:uncharacterized protein [Macrobrachium rosenbergii]|uniref:uncharacterized protein n=1 Tax=Macrobrachium rosenbergii TaxID=79674 RepID=UPI0034D41C5A